MLSCGWLVASPFEFHIWPPLDDNQDIGDEDEDDKGESDDDRVDDEPPSHPSLTPAVSRWLAVLNKHRLSFCGATIIWQEDNMGEKKMKMVFSRHHDDMIRYTWAVASASYLANGEGSAKSKQRFWRTTDWLTHNIIQ